MSYTLDNFECTYLDKKKKARHLPITLFIKIKSSLVA